MFFSIFQSYDFYSKVVPEGWAVIAAQPFSGVFRILILQVPSVNRIFPLWVLTVGAISLFLNITGAIAPMAPVLNTPLFDSDKKLSLLLRFKKR